MTALLLALLTAAAVLAVAGALRRHRRELDHLRAQVDHLAGRPAQRGRHRPATPREEHR